MKIKKFLVLLISLLLIISGCSNQKQIDNDKLQIITTLFPQYDFTKTITLDRANVSLLLNPGVEAHSYDPTPKDIVNIKNADVFIYTNLEMEPWVEKIISEANDDLLIIDLSENLLLLDVDDDHGHSYDPHIWLDPIYAIEMVKSIGKKLSDYDVNNRDFYLNNSSEYVKKLTKLDNEFKDLVENSENDTIVFGGHFAFNYFTKRYNLKHISPYVGFSPNSEPTPKKISEIIEVLKNSNTKVIYFEELVEPKVANVISEQSGADLLLLHAAHNISKDELDNNLSFIEIMYQNLENLKIGLNYGK